MKTKQDIREVLLRILSGIAPEADLSQIDWDVRVRDQLDIDSMDFLNFLIAVDEELGIDIPERHYPKLRTLNDCLDYLQARLHQGKPGGGR